MHADDVLREPTTTSLPIPTLTEKELRAIAGEHTEAVYRYPEGWPSVVADILGAGVCVTCRQPWDRTYGCPTRKALFALHGRQLEAEQRVHHVEELTATLARLAAKGETIWHAEPVLELRLKVSDEALRAAGPELIVHELQRMYRDFAKKWRELTGQDRREAAASALNHALADAARRERRG